MSDKEDEEVSDKRLRERGIVRRACTKENPFRPGVDDTTHTHWTHEGAELDQYDIFATCPNCGVSWQEMYKDI